MKVDILRVGVLMGGTSSERDVSLASGRAILDNLNPSRYEKISVVIGPNGAWWIADGPTSSRSASKSPGAVLDDGGFDLMVLALHGPGGEDGTVQGLLEQYGLPYTCSGVLASALAMHKTKTKIILVHAGIPTPAWRSIPVSCPVDEAAATALKFSEEAGYPLVVKPAESGSSFGVSIVRSAADLVAALHLAREEGGEILVEERIAGREMQCGVLGNSAEGHSEALPVTEVIPNGEFFDYENKYTPGLAEEVTPADIDEGTTKMIQGLAVSTHEALGCDGLSRVDMILRDGEAFVLEANTIPGMTETSLCPQQARAAGMTFGDLLDRMIELALRRKGVETRAVQSSKGL